MGIACFANQSQVAICHFWYLRVCSFISDLEAAAATSHVNWLIRKLSVMACGHKKCV